AAAEQAAREKAAAEQAAREKAAAEQAARAAAQGEQMIATYESYIRDRISNNWNRPPSARRDMEVQLRIRLVPTGQVMGVSVVRSSGDPAFDQSAVNAVQQAGRFERLQELARKDPLLFERTFRTLTLTFRAEDLRL
ncbi:MAG: cell envelope integrity protein TolA, partial [Pseudomonadota bacterium]